MSKYLLETSLLLVEDLYGDLPARILDVLGHHDRLSFPQVVRLTNLPPKHVRTGLVLLVQQNLVLFHPPAPTNSTHYQANVTAAYDLLRFVKTADVVRKRYGQRAAEIISHIQELGFATKDEILENNSVPVAAGHVGADETLANGVKAVQKHQHLANGFDKENGSLSAGHDQNNVENPDETIFHKLLVLGYLESVRDITFMPHADFQSAVEDLVKLDMPQFRGTVTGPKKTANYLLEIENRKRRIIEGEESIELPEHAFESVMSLEKERERKLNFTAPRVIEAKAPKQERDVTSSTNETTAKAPITSSTRKRSRNVEARENHPEEGESLESSSCKTKRLRTEASLDGAVVSSGEGPIGLAGAGSRRKRTIDVGKRDGIHFDEDGPNETIEFSPELDNGDDDEAKPSTKGSTQATKGGKSKSARTSTTGNLPLEEHSPNKPNGATRETCHSYEADASYRHTRSSRAEKKQESSPLSSVSKGRKRGRLSEKDQISSDRRAPNAKKRRVIDDDDYSGDSRSVCHERTNSHRRHSLAAIMPTSETQQGLNLHDQEGPFGAPPRREDGESSRKIGEPKLLRINKEKLLVLYRTDRLTQLSASCLGQYAAQVYGAALRLLEQYSKRCNDGSAVYDDSDPDEDEVTFAPRVTTNQVADLVSPDPGMLEMLDEDYETNQDETRTEEFVGLEVEKELEDNRRKSKKRRINGEHKSSLTAGLGTTSQRKLNSREHYDCVNMWLNILANHQYNFLCEAVERGSREWTIDYAYLSRLMIQLEVEKAVSAQFGQFGASVVRILSEKKHLDEKQLNVYLLEHPSRLRSTLPEMRNAGMLNVREIARDNTHHPGRTIYLWYYEHDRARKIVLDNTYKSMSRLLQRLKTERVKYATVLLLADTGNGEGDDERFLKPNQREQLREWRAKEDKMLLQLHRLDDVVMVLRDFSPFAFR